MQPEFPSRQTEFEFPLPPRRRPNTATRAIAPLARRLEISPEAFEPRADPASGPLGVSPHRLGLVEAGIVLLATMAFGLGWAAFELDRGDPATRGYAAAASPDPAGPAFMGDGEGRWDGIGGRVDATRRLPSSDARASARSTR